MTIIQLEYLLAVANYGSFTLASERCFVTQPSLSMQIKSLEDELGVILLDRSKKPVIPTEAGSIVLAQARETLNSFRRIKEVVQEMKGEISGTLRLGVIPTIAPYLLHRFLPSFVQQYPSVELEIREMLTGDIVESMNRDMLDGAIVAGGTVPEDINEHELFNDTFHVYVSPQNPLYERSNIRIEDIDPEQLILLFEGHCMRNQILELCQKSRNNHSSYSFECGSLETIMRIVDTTGMLTIIPQLVVDVMDQTHLKQVRPLAKGATSRKIVLATRRSYIKQSLIKALCDSITTSVKTN